MYYKRKYLTNAVLRPGAHSPGRVASGVNGASPVDKIFRAPVSFRHAINFAAAVPLPSAHLRLAPVWTTWRGLASLYFSVRVAFSDVSFRRPPPIVGTLPKFPPASTASPCSPLQHSSQAKPEQGGRGRRAKRSRSLQFKLPLVPRSQTVLQYQQSCKRRLL